MGEADQFRLIDVFRTDTPVIDKWTFVFNETNPYNHGYYTMLATSETGWGFSQWTEGDYDPGGDNAHLGYRPRRIGETLVNYVLSRMTEGEAYTTSALQDFLERADMPQE